ncbi:MAG: hypothetical protein DPW16_06095 [Chloroflexi bacterium]|nr:hypothetical protein [Chloroflexota bacterium]
MRFLKYKITACFLITLLAALLPNYNSKAQSPSDFPVVASTELFPFDDVDFFSNDLHYYFKFGFVKDIIDTVNPRYVFSSAQPGWSIAGWSSESSYLAFIDDQGPCLENEFEGNLVLFSTDTEEIIRICVPSMSKYAELQWSPFDEYHLAIFEEDQLQIFDIRTQVSIPFTLPDEIDLNDLDQLVGYGNYLWSPETNLPVARVNLRAFGNSNMLSASEFEICSTRCVTLLDTLENAPNSGAVFGSSLWKHWLTWGVYEFTGGIPYTGDINSINQINDAVIYMTDLRTLDTQTLFRFSSLNLSGLRVSSLGWSPNGKTISLPLGSIDLQDEVGIDETPFFDTGSLLLHLDWPAPPDDNPTGEQ